MPDSNRLILVTGATGHQGQAALRHLLEQGFAVRAMTRDPAKPQAREIAKQGAEVVQGDLNDPASITRAIQGAYGVYSVQDSRQGGEPEIRMANNLTDASTRAGIRHLVYSSVGSADQHTGIPHFESKAAIEEHLHASGIPWTVIRPVFFMENWLAMKKMIDGGTIQWPLKPETGLQMIAVDDIGAFVAMAFADSKKWQGRAIDLAGDDLSMTDIGKAFTRTSGREVTYRQIPWEPFEQQVGQELTTMYRWFQNTGYHVEIAAIRKEYPKLTSFSHWLDEHWPKDSRAAGS